MQMLKIPQGGFPPGVGFESSPHVDEVVRAMIALYQAAGYEEPWVGYLALDGDRPIGACSFKSPPCGHRVEIAYFTFPGLEGRGYATQMARTLIDLARRTNPEIVVFAQTLPQKGPSTAILGKLGFELVGERVHPEDGTVWEWEVRPV